MGRGLTAEEAARRLTESGANELRAAPKVATWRRVPAQFQDPLVCLLPVAIAIALAAWFIERRVGWPVDASVIAVVVLLNAALGYAQEAKAENAVAMLAGMTAVTSAVLRNGVTLPAPAALSDRVNLVFKGTAVAQGTGSALVTATGTGMATQMGHIAHLLDATAAQPTPLQREVPSVTGTAPGSCSSPRARPASCCSAAIGIVGIVGIIGMIDPPCEEAAKAIGEARHASIRVMMITGDHPRSAARIATGLGIVEGPAAVLTSADLGVVGAGQLGPNVGDPGAVTLQVLATQLLWINLVTDSGPALALGVDPPAGDMMGRMPRRSTDRLHDARRWLDMAEVGLVVAAATLLTVDFDLPGGLIEGGEDLANARTAGFTVLVFASLFVSLVSRSDSASAFRQPFANRWLCAAIGMSALLQVAVVHNRFLNVAFGTARLLPEQWLVCAAMAGSVLWLSELRKWGRRLWARRRKTPSFTSTARL